MAKVEHFDLGAVSAYALAVAHGYVGTEEEWAVLQAQAGQNAQAAAKSAEEAAQAAANAAQAAADGVRQAVAEDAEKAAQAAEQAQAVKASIPADYAELSGEVTRISGEMVVLDLLADNASISGKPVPLTLADGKVVTATGEIIDSSAHYKASEPIEVVPGELLILSASMHYGHCICAFYDGNGALVSSILAAAGSAITTVERRLIVVPKEAATMRIGVNSQHPYSLENNVTMGIEADTVADKAVTYDNLDNNLAAAFAEGDYEEIPLDYAVSGKYIAWTNGKLYDLESINCTDYIDCTQYRKIRVTGQGYSQAAVLALYDENKAFLAAYPSEAGFRDIDEKIELPENARYMVVSDLSAMTGVQTTVGKVASYAPVYPRTKWVGRKWVCVGDSLTDKNLRTTKNYHDFIKDATGITVVNFGVSGSGYARRSAEGEAFYQRISSVPTDADVVTIFGSGNDLNAGLELGAATDTGTETLCGCINTTIDNLIAIMPAVSLGIVSPTPWTAFPPGTNNAMSRYVDALKSVCEIRSIPYLDLYHCSNLRPWTEEGRAACYTKDEGSGVHPDETGHKLIAPRFKAFLDTLLL